MVKAPVNSAGRRRKFPIRPIVTFSLLAISAFGLWYRWRPWVVERRLSFGGAPDDRPGGYLHGVFTSDEGRIVLLPGGEGRGSYWNIKVLDARTGESMAELKECMVLAQSSAGRRYHWRALLRYPDPRAGEHCWVTDTNDPESSVELKAPEEGPSFFSIKTACLSPDGGRIVTTDGDDPVVWDLQTGAVIHVLRGRLRGRWDLEIPGHEPEGYERLEDDFTYEDFEKRKFVVYSGRHHATVTGALFSPDGKRVLSTSEDGTARMWDAATGGLLLKLAGHEGAVASAAFSPDGARVATASRDGTARVWDGSTGKVLLTLAHKKPLAWAVFSPDGTQLLTVSEPDEVTCDIDLVSVWDAATGEPVFRLSEGECHGAGYTPDGSRLIVVWLNFWLLYDARTGELLAHLSAEFCYENGQEHPGGLRPDMVSAFCSADGTRVLTPSWRRNEVHIWRRRRSERWWAFPEVFLTPALALLLIWSVWRYQKS